MDDEGQLYLLLSVAVVVFWFVFYIWFAKVIAMTGLVFAESPAALGLIILNLATLDSLSSGTIAMRQILGSCYQNGKAFAVPSWAHAARLGQTLGPRTRLLGLDHCGDASDIARDGGGIDDLPVLSGRAFNFGSYIFPTAARATTTRS